MPLITVAEIRESAQARDLPPAPQHVNLDPPKPSQKPPTYAEYVRRLQAACVRKGIPLDLVGTVWSGGYHRVSYPVYRAVIRRPSDNQGPVCWVAGLHGEEPAGPLGVLEFLENPYPAESRGALCPVYPCANPWGFDHQRRPNGHGTDVNRTFGPEGERCEESAVLLGDMTKFRFNLLHTLHEDGTRTGFYLYYSDPARRWLAERLVACATAHHLPINSSPIDFGGVVRLDRGLAAYDHSLYAAPQAQVPLEDHWLAKGVHHFCTETPLQADAWSRVKCQADLVRMVWTFG